jgi:hypothetical protein
VETNVIFYREAKKNVYRGLRHSLKDNKITRLEKKTVAALLRTYNLEYLSGITNEVLAAGREAKAKLNSNFRGVNSSGYFSFPTKVYDIQDVPVGQPITISNSDFGYGKGQKNQGTCAILAAAIDNLRYVNNGDGTFTFKFYNSTLKPDYVTITSDADPFETSGDILGLAEKAFAVWTHEIKTGFSNRDLITAWKDVTTGNTLEIPLKAMTGREVTINQSTPDYSFKVDEKSISQALAEGKSVLLANIWAQQPQSVISNDHAYKVVAAGDWGIELVNPWGYNNAAVDKNNSDGKLRLSLEQVDAFFLAPYLVIS